MLVGLVAFPVLGTGQDRFDESRMARSADIYGYTTYHNQFRAPDNAPRHDYYKDVNDRHRSAVPKRALSSGRQGGADLHSDVSLDASPRVSKLEQFYRDKTNEANLNQFGYNFFQSIDFKYKKIDAYGGVNAPMGVVQDSYVIQVGDEISIVFQGERKDRRSHKILSDGQLRIENFPPIAAAGKTIAAMEGEVNHHLSTFDYQGRVDISVLGMRQIGVLVAGHVQSPGRHTLNAFHSLIDALQIAGGVVQSGSLRQIKLVRGGKTIDVDLYGFLVDGQSLPDVQLSDGDRIIVPPVGPTMAVVGDVKQSGIFELRPDARQSWRGVGIDGARKISLRRALVLAGGMLSAGQNKFTLIDSNSQIINLNNKNQMTIGDGAVLRVDRAMDRLDDAIELKGYSRNNGVYNIGVTPTLGALLASGRMFGDDVYPLMGVITRLDRKTLTRQIIGFSPQLIAQGAVDRPLVAGDTVYLFSYGDINEILNHQKEDDQGQTRVVEGADFPRLVQNYVWDNIVTVNGAVRDSGGWPVGDKATIESLMSVAGGFAEKANKSAIEIVSRGVDGATVRRTIDISQSSRMLVPGDQIRVAETFEKALNHSVRLTGEVYQPGTYDLMRGDTLLSVIERAGGVTDQAYPAGAVFSRKSERRRDDQKFRAAAQDLERTVSVNLNAVDKNASLTPAQISMARDLADDLRSIQSVGRITVEADPAVLMARPELDLLLEDGDRIHIPKRPMNVRVSGEVLSPATLLFVADKDVGDYLSEAGGTTYYADKSRKFVLYPDGSAKPLGGWSDKPAMIIPGSTIIVPRDPKPFNFMDSFKDITQILTNMAITGVFVEDIATDEN